MVIQATIGSLFTGYAGLDMAAEHAFGARTVWHSENDPAACRLLAHRFPGVPNHGDITTTDWSTVEPADVLTAGWPCQPWSLAGKRKGAADERALWPHVATAVRMVRPRWVVLENVPAVVTAGELARAVTDLATLGYVGSWTCLRAADVGAPHRRERVFIVATDAHSEAGRPEARLTLTNGGQGPDEQRQAQPGRCRSSAPDSVGKRRRTEGWHHGVRLAELVEEPAPDASCERRPRLDEPLTDLEHNRQESPYAGPSRRIDFGSYRPAVERWERLLGRVAPPPTEPGRTGALRLSPCFVEWMMGLPEGWVTDVPSISRNDQLKLLGNGVVPQQAESALRWLLATDARAKLTDSRSEAYVQQHGYESWELDALDPTVLGALIAEHIEAVRDEQLYLTQQTREFEERESLSQISRQYDEIADLYGGAR